MRYLFAFLLRNHFFFLFLLLEAISVILLAEHSYYIHSRMTGSVSEVTGSIHQTVNNISRYFHLREASLALSEENAMLRSRLEDAYLLRDTLHYEKTDTSRKQQYRYMSVRVISNSVTTRNNYLMLDKGSLHGIRADMAVISPEGIVGIVSHVSKNFSWVISVLHKQSRISARISNSGFVGTITWQGPDYRTGKLQDIPANVQLSKGDTVVTSGYSHIFPPNLMIGTISDYRVDQGYNFYDISLTFSQDLNKLTHVYVVTDFYRDEKTELERFRVDE